VPSVFQPAYPTPPRHAVGRPLLPCLWCCSGPVAVARPSEYRSCCWLDPGIPKTTLENSNSQTDVSKRRKIRPRKPRGERSYGDTFCSVTSPGHPDKQATMAAAFPDTLRRTFENSNSQVGILVALPRTARRRQNASIARRWSRAFPHQGRSRSTCAGKKHCQKAAAPMLVRRLGLIVEPDLTALALRAVKQAFWPNQQIGAPSTARLACRELRVGQ
jgi:hypothetical protein